MLLLMFIMVTVHNNSEDVIVLTIEDTQIVCDREKLIHHSPYFQVMFNGNFTEKDKSNINLQDVKAKGMISILNLINKKIDSIPFDDIYDALENACMLQFDFVKQHCIEKLEKSIDVYNCLRIWHLADKLDIYPLTEKAKCKALLDFNDIRKSDSLFVLNAKELHSYLSSTLLHCDNEIDVFETGIKWWYDYCKRSSEFHYLENSDRIKFETKHLLVILRCLDYTILRKIDIENIFLLYPDVNNNIFTKNVLNNIVKLINGEQISNNTVEEKTAVEFFHNCHKRQLSYLPCVVCHEYNEDFSRNKRFKYMISKCIKTASVYYYEKNSKSLLKLLDLCRNNEDRCTALLEGYQIIPYREKLLFFGGENQYGTSDWNKSVWIYNSLTEDWTLLTTLPKERRHFKSIIIDDILYIIGGTGKYRIIQDNMMIYNIKNGEWDSLVKLPPSLYGLKCCKLKNQLFLTTGKFENKFGYMYHLETKTWQRINIVDPTKILPKEIGNYVTFSLNDYLYIKGTHLIQIEFISAQLVVKKCVQLSTKLGGSYELGCCQNKNLLYLFSNHTNDSDLANIYVLEQCNIEMLKSRTLLQINDSLDVSWNINAGCFSFFHYICVKNSKSVLDFVF